MVAASLDDGSRRDISLMGHEEEDDDDDDNSSCSITSSSSCDDDNNNNEKQAKEETMTMQEKPHMVDMDEENAEEKLSQKATSGEILPVNEEAQNKKEEKSNTSSKRKTTLARNLPEKTSSLSTKCSSISSVDYDDDYDKEINKSDDDETVDESVLAAVPTELQRGASSSTPGAFAQRGPGFVPESATAAEEAEEATPEGQENASSFSGAADLGPLIIATLVSDNENDENDLERGQQRQRPVLVHAEPMKDAQDYSRTTTLEEDEAAKAARFREKRRRYLYIFIALLGLVALAVGISLAATTTARVNKSLRRRSSDSHDNADDGSDGSTSSTTATSGSVGGLDDDAIYLAKQQQQQAEEAAAEAEATATDPPLPPLN